MASKNGKGRPKLHDWHLWEAVTDTVAPLRRKPLVTLDAEPLPLPPDNAPSPKRAKAMPRLAPMPAYSPPPQKLTQDRSPGLEPRLKRRLGRGQIEIDGRIDLHGMRQDEARAALGRFIAWSVGRGHRTVLVITGKGLKKVETAATIVERGVLRSMLPVWLSEPGLAPLVAGWDVSAQSHGGEGAYYVRLKRQ